MPVEAAVVRRTFPKPISALPMLERAATDLTDDLVALLVRRGLSARRLDLTSRRFDGGVHAICFGTASTTCGAAHLGRLFCARFAGVDPGFGLKEATLAAGPSRWRRCKGKASISVDGAGRPRRARRSPLESRVPERSQRRALPLISTDDRSWLSEFVRPIRLFEPPEPVQASALLPDAPPALFVWRGVRHSVVRADDPKRVRGEWWAAEGKLASLRDYYRVGTEDGGRYWIYRDAPMAEEQRW